MPYPSASRLELPILQELAATGGTEELQLLYRRLIGYFPQLTGAEIAAIGDGEHDRWRRLVQRAGASLVEKRQIERHHGRWTITSAGRRRVDEEALQFALTEGVGPGASEKRAFSHEEAQRMLLEIGGALGYHAEAEFDGYDVVWRVYRASPRLSHVFEVQRRGSLDSALARLKRAYDAQRSRPFLIVASERDTVRAERSLNVARHGAFHEIGRVTAILSFEQLRRLHRALWPVRELLALFFER